MSRLSDSLLRDGGEDEGEEGAGNMRGE